MTWSTVIVYAIGVLSLPAIGVLSLPAIGLGMYLARKGKDIYEEIPKDL
jgi:hypothetical protein